MYCVNLIVLSIFKSRILWKRHWFLFILEFVIPIALFVPSIYFIDPYYYEGDHSPLTHQVALSDEKLMKESLPHKILIYYTPNTSFTDHLISKVKIRFETVLSGSEKNASVTTKGFETETEMLQEYNSNSKWGRFNPIVFRAADSHNLDYVFKDNYVSSRLYDSFSYNDGTTLILQYAIDRAYVEMVTSKPVPLKFFFELYESHVRKYSGWYFIHYFPIITVCTFLILCPTILRSIVEEKKCGSKEYLKMVGMKPYLYYIGWALHAFSTKIIIISIIVCILKFAKLGGATPTLQYSSGFLYFIFLTFYAIAAITFCMMISTFFNRPLVAMALGLLIWVGTLLPYIAFLDEASRPWSLKILASLLPNMALYFGYSEIRLYEWRGIGLSLNNFYKSAAEYPDDVTFLQVLIMFVLQIVLYFSVTLYFDNVITGPYGLPKKFYYPLTELYQFIMSKNKKIPIGTNLDTEQILNREEAKGLGISVEIKGLYKTYGNTNAVNGLSLDVYENQITALLGHNGAGKTTTMMIVTGMIQATSGSVLINGLDIKTHVDQIRKEIGWCPQHDLLFPYFTIYDHMIYFSLLRGWSRIEAEVLSEDLLRKMNLYGKRFELVNHISGGMKRKLCLCLALTGKSKVLILDEPTSGMDPESRREVWNMLLEERETRSIIITTHSMEEADVLGDWVAIMAHGSCICYGTPIFLKKKYATGYHLSLLLETNDTQVESVVTNEVVSTIKDSYLKHKSASSLVYVLPMSEKDKFPILLKALEELKGEAPNPKKLIKNMSVNITTLEEVYLRTNEDVPSITRHEDNQGDRAIFLSAALAKAHENSVHLHWHTVAAASFVNEKITVISYSHAQYSGQISLDLVMNSILRMYTQTNNKISTGYDEIPSNDEPEPSEQDIDEFQSEELAEVVWLIAVPAGIFFIMSQFLIFPNGENNSKFKTLQYMAGVPIYLYWLVTFLFDFVVLFLPIAILICMVFLINDSFQGACQFGSLLFFLICYGFPALPYAYFYSYRQSLPCGIALFIFLGLFLGPLLFGINYITWMYSKGTARLLKYVYIIVFPQFGLAINGMKFAQKIVSVYNCDLNADSQRFNYHGRNGECIDCGAVFTGKENLLLDVLIEMFVPFIIHTGIVLFLDSVYMKQFTNMIGKAYTSIRGTRERCISNDNSRLMPNENCIYAKEISKYFGAKPVVKSVTFSVQEGKCFGLLGVNGAGKTTTFRMITRDIVSDTGEIGMVEQGENVTAIDIMNSKYFRKFGYCPQFNAFNYILSAKQLMITMAQLRNFNRNDSERIAEDYLDLLDLRKFGAKPSGKYSGGNKRKLSLALALIGCRPYILLDEPTSGVDPVSRRKIWEVIDILKQVKKVSFILTSHNMEECEALCEDMAIMKEGIIDDAGSILALKHKHGTGVTVKFKLISRSNPSNVQEENTTGNKRMFSRLGSSSTVTTDVDGIAMSEPVNNYVTRLHSLKDEMIRIFRCEIKDEHEGLLHYHIGDRQEWSTIFATVENLKMKFNDIIEDYTVSGTTLEDVFLSVARGLKN